jgi:hypothetical protein
VAVGVAEVHATFASDVASDAMSEDAACKTVAGRSGDKRLSVSVGRADA